MRVVLIAPPAENPWTGGHLFNARVAAHAPAGACELRSVPASRLGDELANLPPEPAQVLALDSLFLGDVPPSAWRGHRVVQLVHSLPAARAPQADAALAVAAVCVTTSGFMAEQVRRRAGHARVQVCRPGVQATLRVAAAATGAAPIVLSVANFERRKGHLQLLQVLTQLTDLAWEWQVAGDPGADPGYAREFAAAVAGHGLAHRIHVLGRLDPDQVQQRMAAADVFALLSRGEPYGMVYAESVASGTPVLAFADGGVPESVCDGVTGRLVAAGDLPAAAAALRTLLVSPGLRQQMRHACAAAAAAFPGWDACAAEFVACCARGVEAAR